MESKSRYKILNVTFLLIAVFAFLFNYYAKESRLEEILKENSSQKAMQLQSISQYYKILAASINTYVINNKQIMSILKEVTNTDIQTQNTLRKELQNLLNEKYKCLKELGFRQMHFHLTDNTSFLRMHKPSKFGDDLTKFRYSVKKVNQTKKPVHGFEEGRVVNGFRNVFPIFDKNGIHLGSVEVSVSSTGYMKMFRKHFFSDIHFLIKKSIVDNKLWGDDFNKHYKDSVESDKYYIQRNNLYTLEENKVHNKALSENSHYKNQVKKYIQEDKIFSLYVSNSSIVAFLPIKNIQDKETVAYFAVYTQSSHILHLRKTYWITNAVILFVLLTILFFLSKDNISRHKILEQKEELSKQVSESSTIIDENIIYSKTDTEGIITEASSAFERLSGYTKDELIGKPHSIIRHPDNSQDFFKEMWRTIQSGKSWQGEVKNKRKDGSSYYTMSTITQKLDRNNNLVGYVSLRLDITEQKEHEKQLLQQSRLAQMGEMISMIAHQWRQPLSAISATAANLETKIHLKSFELNTAKGQEKQNTYFLEKLEAISTYIQNLTSTIDDFRNFYKPNKTITTTTFKEVSQKALGIIQVSLESDAIELIFDYQSNEEIPMYENEMMQVVLNIFKNAQDNFNEKKVKNPKIEILTRDKSLSITDNGGGIPEKIIEKIFDPYFSTKDEKNGTGLGLYMSKTIVEEHHEATLTVENVDGGVCFSIDLRGVKVGST